MKYMLPKTKKEHKYKKIMGFDIETATNNNDFVLACFYSDDLQKICNSKEEVIKFINSKKVRSYNIFATNLAFDFLGCLFEHSDKWSITERNGVIYSFRWYQTKSGDRLKNPVRFYDTIRILPASVEKLGKILNIPKIKHPSCFARQPNNILEQYELENYCMNDAKISYNFIKKIVTPILQKYNIKLKSTIGSIALEDFLTNHLKIPIFQEEEYFREIAFKSYYGGRTETFKRGLFENVYCFDINSLYPSAMLNKFPNPNRSHKIINPTIKHITEYEGVSNVLVNVPNFIDIPPLPYKKDGKLIFPTGEFKGYYNHNELRNAMKYGVTIQKVYETVIYPKTEYFFKSFVEKHYNERLKYQDENNPLQIIEKNILNNLYGKFAFNYKKSSSLIPVHDLDYNKHIMKAKCIVPMFNNEFVSIEDNEPNVPCYSFPIWSSYITSYARINMYKYLIENKNKLIATDTDSIFIHDYNGEIETSKELGCMKLEDGYPINKGYFVRPKMYMTSKPKCKGLKFNNKIDVATTEFFNILDKKPILQQRFTKYRTLIKSEGKLKPNQITNITKKISLEDNKRLWNKEFNPFASESSKPLCINYIEEELMAKSDKLHKDINITHLNNSSFVREILNSEDDLIDWYAKGKDISKEEFITNELSFEFLD